MKKIISIIMIFTIFIFNLSTFSCAASDSLSSLEDIFTKGDEFIQAGERNQTGTINTQGMQEGINLMYNIFVGAGAILATIIGMCLGIKLMMSSSSEEKAQYKKALVVYCVGCFVVFAAVGIWSLVVSTIDATV